jgi:hypothetical protein
LNFGVGGHFATRGMDNASAEKIARNNAAFRSANEEIESAAFSHGIDPEEPAPFICECSDERCTQIIRLTLVEYARVRTNPRWFAHAVGHEGKVAGAVRTVEGNDRYLLVEKVGYAGEVAADLATESSTD